MKERPILFSAPMVRALLDGSKTQTRRIVKQLDPAEGAVTTDHDGKPMGACWAFAGPVIHCPYGQPGDRLWVRESYHFLAEFDVNSPSAVGDLCLAAGYNKPWAPIQYDSDGSRRDWMAVSTPGGAVQAITPGKGRPSIHMPRWASRILLEIISVRAERLNDCSDADARAEGAKHYEPANHLSHGGWSHDEHYVHETAKASFESLWERIGGAGAWAVNPWVWVVEFKRVTP